MRLRLISALVGVATVIVVAFSIPLLSFVARIERERLVTELERDAFILAGHAKETLTTVEGATLPSLEPYIAEHGGADGTKVVVTNAAGLVVATNDRTETIGTDFSNRPEIATALTGVPAVGERESATLGEDLVFVAVPVLLGDDVLGTVRFSERRSEIDAVVRGRIIGISAAGGFTLLAAAGIAVPLALGIVRPLERLRRRTEGLAAGDFTVRADESTGPDEIRELARSFNTMTARLGSMIEGQRAFAGLVSHQLRTPLTALRLRLEHAQDMSMSDDMRADAIDAARVETDRMHEMIEQLLALARLEGGVASVETVDAARVARTRAEMWRPLGDEHGVTIEVTAPEVVRCSVTAGGLEQIIDNYVDNALSVAPIGSAIVIEVASRAGQVIVDVVDRGPGLSDVDRERAFERFWRGSGTQSQSGTGLGLAIVRQIALASGGTVALLADDGGGVRARVVLPAA